MYIGVGRILVLVFTVTHAQDCNPVGWFGSNCQYKCRCAGSDNCNSTEGSCLGGAKCLGGWFGPACQYADLAYETGPDKRITDGDDETCVNNETVQVTITFNESSPFTWLRMSISDSGKQYLKNVTVTLNQTIGLLVCTDKRSVVNARTLDIFCDVTGTVQSLILTGEAVRYLCSVYVSGGRNVALKQSTSQSTDYPVMGSSIKAVDGNTSGNFTDSSCTHTSLETNIPASWNLTLLPTKTVQRILIYNRNEGDVGKRIEGFRLQSFDAAGGLLLNYTDERDYFLPVYHIVVKNSSSLVSSVYIRTAVNSENVLSLCEVELYGDSVCSMGKFGRDCEKDCNCQNKQEACSVSTGGCPYGCAADYQGEGCRQACDEGTYGLDCQRRCSPFCEADGTNLSAVCDHVSDRCLFGCRPGYQKSTCSQHCQSGQYGKDCNSSCSEGCATGEFDQTTCDHINGTCLYLCLPGYLGNRCDTACRPGTFGLNCQNNCSSFCETSVGSTGSVCYHVTGTCLFGCKPVYQGLTCFSQITHGADTEVIIPAVIVPVVALLIITVIIFLFIRRRRLNRESSNPAPYENEPNVNNVKLEPRHTQKAAISIDKVEKKKLDATQQLAENNEAVDRCINHYDMPVDTTDLTYYNTIDQVQR